MKRNSKVFSLLLILVLAATLAGCGSKSYSSASYQSDGYYVGGYNTVTTAEPAAAAESYYYDEAETQSRAESGLGSKSAMNSDAVPMSEKMIYNGRVNLETTEFDAAVERITALINDNGGYLESSSVSGSNFKSISRGDTGARSASYTIRVPSVNFNAIMGSLPEIGNVPYSEISSRNVTREYYDAQSRLEAFKTQEARLLEMLAVAETVEDMLSIQRELTEVQYELDSLNGTLRYYDDQVSYSTIYLNVQEVREYTPEPTITLTYKERMVKGFQESLTATGDFFKEFFLWLVTSLPWLIPLIAVIAIVIAVLRRIFSRNPERAARRAERKAAKKARKQEKKSAKKLRRQEKRAAKKAEKAAQKAAAAAAQETPPAAPPAVENPDSKEE